MSAQDIITRLTPKYASTIFPAFRRPLILSTNKTKSVPCRRPSADTRHHP
ncbi:MAG: hypothetical protein ACR2PY_01925 [Salinispira sp.]